MTKENPRQAECRIELQPGAAFEPFNGEQMERLLSGKINELEKKVLFQGQEITIELHRVGSEPDLFAIDFFSIESIDVKDETNLDFTPQGEVSAGFTYLPEGKPVLRIEAFYFWVTFDSGEADIERVPEEVEVKLGDQTRFLLHLDEKWYQEGVNTIDASNFYGLKGQGPNKGKMFNVILNNPTGLSLTFIK